MSKRIATIGKTKSILEENNLNTKKQYGQNFLVDTNIIDSIIEKSNIDQEAVVLEIGSGIGALTEALISKAKHVVSIEIDYELIPILEANFAGEDNLEIVHDDILMVDLEELLGGYDEEIFVVANLPYYITSDILFFLSESEIKFKNIVVMMQSEVAQRIMGSPNDSDFRAMSVILQNRFEIEHLMDISKQVFYPKPNVNSSVLSFKPKEDKQEVEAFNKFVKQCFMQRRKTIKNNLKGFMDDESVEALISKVGLNPTLRPQAISVEQYNQMFEVYDEKESIC